MIEVNYETFVSEKRRDNSLVNLFLGIVFIAMFAIGLTQDSLDIIEIAYAFLGMYFLIQSIFALATIKSYKEKYFRYPIFATPVDTEEIAKLQEKGVFSQESEREAHKFNKQDYWINNLKILLLIIAAIVVFYGYNLISFVLLQFILGTLFVCIVLNHIYLFKENSDNFFYILLFTSMILILMFGGSLFCGFMLNSFGVKLLSIGGIVCSWSLIISSFQYKHRIGKKK